jgi:Holliday junction DNA helicase RuvA
MIVRLTGVVAEVAAEAVVIERDGIGREVLVPANAIDELGAVLGRVVTLHTLEFIEGAQAGGPFTPRIVGFTRMEDRSFFLRFISTKGIGPRKALKALTEPVRTIAQWIEQGDKKSLTRLPGIGGRAAEIIVAELKGKLEDLALGGAAAVEEVDVGRFTQAQRDAVEVIVAFGDSRGDAERWIARAAELHPELTTSEEWAKLAYRIKVGAER